MRCKGRSAAVLRSTAFAMHLNRKSLARRSMRFETPHPATKIEAITKSFQFCSFKTSERARSRNKSYYNPNYGCRYESNRKHQKGLHKINHEGN